MKEYKSINTQKKRLGDRLRQIIENQLFLLPLTLNLRRKGWIKLLSLRLRFHNDHFNILSIWDTGTSIKSIKAKFLKNIQKAQNIRTAFSLNYNLTNNIWFKSMFLEFHSLSKKNCKGFWNHIRSCIIAVEIDNFE